MCHGCITQAAGQLKRKNFPICFPMWYHDISGDIPEKSRRYVRSAYFCWWVSTGMRPLASKVHRGQHSSDSSRH
jgi:hypothetical protein